MHELTYLLSADLTDEEIQKVVGEVRDLLLKVGAETKNQKTSDKKRLAQPVKKNNFGIFVSIDFKTDDGEKILEIKNWLKGKKKILRHLIVQKPEAAQSEPIKKMEFRPLSKKTGAKDDTAGQVAPKPELTREEKEKQIEEIDKKLDEILSE